MLSPFVGTTHILYYSLCALVCCHDTLLFLNMLFLSLLFFHKIRNSRIFSFSCSVRIPFLLHEYFHFSINNGKNVFFCGVNLFCAYAHMESFRCQDLLGMHILRGPSSFLIHHLLVSGFQNHFVGLCCLRNLQFLPG